MFVLVRQTGRDCASSRWHQQRKNDTGLRVPTEIVLCDVFQWAEEVATMERIVSLITAIMPVAIQHGLTRGNQHSLPRFLVSMINMKQSFLIHTGYPAEVVFILVDAWGCF